MAECDHNCSNCSSKCEGAPKYFNLNQFSHIKHIIGVVSGKGGVGKSATTSLLATAFQKNGYKVGILDADITGPSIPKGFGIKDGIKGNENLMFPQLTKLGIKIVSINLLLQHEDDPVLWRGPVVGGAIKQFYEDVLWEDLDYLFIDMPPGTGDVALTIFQSVPLDGVIIISTPQDLVQMIVGKALKMANMMNIPVLGLIENMSYIKCPNCNTIIEPFGPSKLVEIANVFNIKPLIKMPIDPNLTALIDKGCIEDYDTNYLNDLITLINKDVAHKIKLKKIEVDS